jgi:RNA polymerase sigma-70 factor (ECF subfamily)
MSRLAAYDDEEARALLRRVAQGDQAAYRVLYELMAGRMYAFLRRMLSNSATADEVFSDAFYEVWRLAGQFRGDSKVMTWALGIARNKALMAIRSAGSVTHEDIDEVGEFIDSGVPDGFEQLASKEVQEIIRRCMQRLSEKHRECIHLTHFEDCSMAEIASLLGVPEGTVKSRLSHARAQLAECVSAVMQRGGEK